MNTRQIPSAIITAATAILQPYFPELSAAGLIDSLNRQNKAEQPEQQYFTRGEIASLFKVSRATVDNWIKAGHLKAIKTGRRNVRITADSVKSFSKNA